MKKQRKISVPHTDIYLIKSRTQNSFFLSPNNKSEIQNISLLDSNKSVGSNSIPTKILKLLKNDISSKIADIFIASFFTGAFPTILRLSLCIKKTPNWTFQTISQFHYYSKLKRY